MYNYKGLTVSWKTQDCERNLREKILPFRGLAFEVIDNYGNKIDEFDGAYGIDLKADENAIKGYIRKHMEQNEEQYKKIISKNGICKKKIIEDIENMNREDKYKLAYHLLETLDKDGSILYETAKEQTGITPETFYHIPNEQNFLNGLISHELVKYAEAAKFGEVIYEDDVLKTVSVDYGSEAYKRYESDLYKQTVGKMLDSEMSLEDMMNIQHNFLDYKCNAFSYNPLHTDKEITYIVQEDIDKAEVYGQSAPYKELPENRARAILSGALDYLSESLRRSNLYEVLSGSVGMLNEEITDEGFELDDYYEEDEDEYDM